MTTGTLTGKYHKADGTPLTGKVYITPSVGVVRDETGNVILSGTTNVELDNTGAFSVALAASDDLTLDPSGVTYKVSLRGLPPVVGVFIPAGQSVDMADVTPVDPAAPTYAVQVSHADVADAVAVETTRATGVEALKVNASTYTAGQATQDAALVSEAATARAAEGGLRNLTDATFASNLSASFASSLTPTAVKTSAYSAAAGDMVPGDATSGALVVTLPTAPADRSRVAVKKIDTGANLVTVTAGGSDVFNKSGGSTSLTLSLPNQAVNLQYKASTGIWYVVGDDLPLSQLDARYLAQVATATAGARGISPNPVNTKGASADNYFVVGGETAFPHSIGNARLAFVLGYDNHIWNSSLAAMTLGFHCVVDANGGHSTCGGGSLHAIMEAYGTASGGTGHGVYAAKGTVTGGDSNSAGANGVVLLSVATTVGATTITVKDIDGNAIADPTVSTIGMAVGQKVFIGLGTPGLDNGNGPLERATVASIAGNVITLSTFQAVSTTNSSGVSTGTSLTAIHPIGTRVYFSDNTKTGAWVGGGYLLDACGQYSGAIHGQGSQAKGNYSTAYGYFARAEADFSQASGRYARARTYGQVARANGRFAANGDTQHSVLHVFGTTTDGTTAVTLNPSGSGGTMHQLLRGQTVLVTAHIVGKSVSSGGASVKAAYVVKRVATFEDTGNSAWLGTEMKETVYEDAGMGGITFTAGSSVGSINVKVTGKAATTMQWTGKVELTEVTF